MRRLVPRKLYGIQGNANEAQFTLFKADFFNNGVGVPIDINVAMTTGLIISAATTTGILVSGAATSGISITGACTDGIIISSICADAIHISGANTVSAIHISGNQAVAVLVDVDAALATGLSFAVDTGITMSTGIAMTCTGTGTISSAIKITYTNSATEGLVMTVASGKTLTQGISMSGAGTVATGIIFANSLMTNAISVTGVCGGACIDFGPLCITTGSLIDYIGITGKVSGYLFNGSMTSSTLIATTILDDFSTSCVHDGLAADTLRMIRRSWTGSLPNGTAAADFVIAEFSFSGQAGTDTTKTGAVTGVKIDLGSSTLNDDNITSYGLYVDNTPTNTKSAAVHGIYVTATDYAISIGADCSSAINIVDASAVTNVFIFNEVAGCVVANDVDPDTAPSAGGLGATGSLVIDVNGTPYYIPIFDTIV